MQKNLTQLTTILRFISQLYSFKEKQNKRKPHPNKGPKPHPVVESLQRSVWTTLLVGTILFSFELFDSSYKKEKKQRRR